MPRRRNHHKSKGSEVRIIGGKWKGRKLRFTAAPGLHPTPARVRETLFSWLRPEIAGTRCLDLFAGSGVIGLEALSEGAATLVAVELHSPSAAAIERLARDLGADAHVCRADAIAWLRRCPDDFDIAFIDPPYDAPELLETALEIIATQRLVRRFVYVEARQLAQKRAPIESLGYAWYRETRAGDARAALLTPPPP